MPKVETLVTPIGKVKFPKTIINDKEHQVIFVPESIDDAAFNQWKFQLVFDPKEGKELLAKLDKLAKPIKGANFVPYKDDKDKAEDGSLVDTGLVAINFTSGYPIGIVDAEKNPCHEKIGWGSKVKVLFSTKPVNNKGKVGLGRYVKAIQVIELQESGMDLSSFGKEEGYVAKATVSAADQPDPWETEEE